METICSGCLARDRKLIEIQEVSAKKIYSHFIEQFQDASVESLPIALCWECDARVKGFEKFRRKAILSYETLLNCLKLKTIPKDSESKSSLKTQQVYQFNVQPKTDAQEYNTFEVLDYKTDLPIIDDDVVKNELSDQSNDGYETLAEIKREKLKKKVKLKKITSSKVKKKKKTECYKEIVLTEEEINEERKSLALDETYINSIYKCEKCIVSFPNADDLQDHAESKHDSTAKYKCDICDCTFALEVSFNYHSKRHVKRYECNKCQDRFATARKAERHYETHLFVPSFKCDECQDQFGTEEELQIHNIKIHKKSEPIVKTSENTSEQPQKSYPCTVCSKTFKWKTSLRKHMEMHNIEAGVKRRPYCETCRLAFTTSASLQKHMKSSSNHQVLLKRSKLADPNAVEAAAIKPSKGAHSCPLCGHCYQFRGNLRRHMESHLMRANGSLVCAPCNRTFSSQATFQQHIKFSRSHITEDDFQANGSLVCAPCNRTFSSQATFQQHIKFSRSHITEDDFQYVCTECGARFVSKTRLRDHMDWEHLKRYRHVCADCQKVFKSHTSLYLHQQVVHKKGGVEHLCDHCGKGFPTLTKLRAHVSALHSARAAHACRTCGARFSWASCLARHVKTMHKAQQ